MSEETDKNTDTKGLSFNESLRKVIGEIHTELTDRTKPIEVLPSDLIGLQGTIDTSVITPKSTRTVGLKNTDEGINPKDVVGSTKVDLTLIPRGALVPVALAFMDGAHKYGEYNWRVKPIQMRTFLGAIYRHADAVLDGEDVAQDSLILHLGHIAATALILIDSMQVGTCVDNRPIKGYAGRFIDATNGWIKDNKPEWSKK